MTSTAVIFLIVTIVVVWGGLIASIVALRRRPEAENLPEGGHDDDGVAPVVDSRES
ncbi:Putative methionine and alanine importer, small subunit [Paraoerskovia marina]|uniref:Putative methionine and alanine importer, small subunit n=1 Tax=Paraoerskovia marina TaxID=545619 RepID=A0A1H1NP75_9CELL|nr:methionine/alanine import family NSS transporter small subunit [Paraoerskovia marina]SDS00109.1 Putative methionine and alanine importer, small subunit [Paraoerskovia marina]